MNKESPINTITEFMESTGTKLRVFDMGRRISKISRDSFLQFEQCQLPYPYPIQQQAWFALLFQDNNKKVEPFIWFLRFPLDEQGKLLLATRDDFMHRLMERIGENLQAAKEGNQLDAALKDNPYTFKPRDDRLAVFHAKASLIFKHPPSQYFEHAKSYFSGELGWDQWSFVGYQGIAELAARQDDTDINRIVVTAIPYLPDQPLEALCHCLENEPVNMEINAALNTRMDDLLLQPEPNSLLIAACLRGIASSQSKNLKQAQLTAMLQHKYATSPDILAAISGRLWEALLDDNLRMLYLEKLAINTSGQDFFNQCLSDLMFIPGMRQPFLESIRNPNRSSELGAAIGALFQGLSS